MNTTIDAQNIDKITKEFKKGDKLLSKLGPAVTIYGSARAKPSSKEYKDIEILSEKLALSGFSIISGGGPGIMEASNKGAFNINNINSVGLGIELPFETKLNDYIDIGYTFKYFFVRKVMMVKYAKAFVVAGAAGIGTIEEFMETLTLIQTQKTDKAKVYLIGTEFWGGLINWLKNTVLKNEYISQSDLDNIIITDDIDFIVNDIKKS